MDRFLRLVACACLCALLGAPRDARAGDPPIFADGFDAVPIAATAGAWTWVAFPDSSCGNGSTTGIGINPSATGGTRVVIFLTGGGGCWDTLTCITLQTAANFNTGYGPPQFANDQASFLNAGFFDRTRATNPFRDDSYVFVPYCTGDVHAGNNPSVNYGGNIRRHVGYANVGAYLERIVPTFPNASRVVLAGSSAGGFGATANWLRTQAAFGNVRVDAIDDSGTFMPASIVSPGSAAEVARFNNWNLAATIPAGCSACFNGIDNLYTYNAQQLPNRRGALLSYRPDPTLSAFFQISQSSFSNGLDIVRAVHFDPFSSRRYFVLGASGHVLFDDPGNTGTGGVTLEQWLTQMLSDDPGWSNVAP
ncbi:MAG TPA: pectin acetylesterase-family hydrolase [Xanthomonadales bacterium]|nr:pectin acetylesterase-family hydrolase [Xanthomonadales bacterium]